MSRGGSPRCSQTTRTESPSATPKEHPMSTQPEETGMPDELGPLPECHPRELPTLKALSEMMDAVQEIKERHSLSFAELMWCLASVTTSWSGIILGLDRKRKK